MVAFKKINRFFLNTISLFLFFVSLSLQGFEFVAISDLHVGRDNLYLNARKLEVKRLLLNYLHQERNNINFVLMAGDLTDHGSINNNCGFQNEWENFLNEWFFPIAEKIGRTRNDICLCPGNHDTGYHCGKKLFDGKTAFDVLKENDFVNYFFESGDVMFICCGIYPGLNTRKWLSSCLRKINTQIPIVLFFHYTISRPCHGFDDEEKETFYEIIKNHNVLGIINGHKHGSFIEQWHNIPVVGVGGYGYTICSISKNNKLRAKTVFADRKRFFSV